jgi:hypothetical protein
MKSLGAILAPKSDPGCKSPTNTPCPKIKDHGTRGENRPSPSPQPPEFIFSPFGACAPYLWSPTFVPKPLKRSKTSASADAHAAQLTVMHADITSLAHAAAAVSGSCTSHVQLFAQALQVRTEPFQDGPMHKPGQRSTKYVFPLRRTYSHLHLCSRSHRILPRTSIERPPHPALARPGQAQGQARDSETRYSNMPCHRGRRNPTSTRPDLSEARRGKVRRPLS